ncbi:aminotransferase class V-fold PLP-dependent enzyme [bacterium]|nr:aminotransferase class V-fold PLP-dependent enzyme [bacterium]
MNGKSFNKVAEKFAEENICVRGGGHCAYPLHKFLNANGSVRISLSVYNDETDIHKFFEVVDQLSQ